MVGLAHIYKSYKDQVVLDDLSYCFKKGIYLIRGDNGAGKTTLLNIISQRIKADKGEVSLSDEVFCLSTSNTLIENFTVKENLELYKEIYPKFKLIKGYEIKDLLNKKVSKLSKGERQRVGIYLSLASNCKIVLLDEPFAGLDKPNLKQTVKIIKRFAKTRLFIIVSHLLINGKNIKELRLKDGKLNETTNLEVVSNSDIQKHKLNNCYKWVGVLYKKQFFSKLIFVLSLINILVSYRLVNHELDNLKEEFINDFSFNQNLYYKENKGHLNEDVFYNEIVKNLAREVIYYGVNIYSEKMYEGRVFIEDNYVDNGFIFTNVVIDNNLLDNEVILQLDSKQYCQNNYLVNCDSKLLFNELEGRELVYEYNKKKIRMIIKKVDEGDNRLYIGNENIIKEIYASFTDYKQVYNLVIDLSKLESFYQKIRENESLLKYEFNFIYKDDKYAYFEVLESDLEYFSEKELNEEMLVCLDIGFSCNSFEFSKFKSLVQIDNLSVIDKIYYQNSNLDLDYDEIIISSSLANLLNKQVGDSLKLYFYFDEEYHLLEGVKIVDIKESDKLIISHSKYDYELFYKRFNKQVRVKYIYGENELAYSKRNLLYDEILSNMRDYLFGLVNFISYSLLLLDFLAIIVLFVIDLNKFKKQDNFFKVLKANHVNGDKLFNMYYLGYLLFGVIFIFNKELFIEYLSICLICYLLKRRKIKSRFPWI